MEGTGSKRVTCAGAGTLGAPKADAGAAGDGRLDGCSSMVPAIERGARGREVGPGATGADWITGSGGGTTMGERAYEPPSMGGATDAWVPMLGGPSSS